MIIRRVLTIGGLVTILTIVGTAPVFADDLGDYLADASEAIYSGRRIVGTTWDGFESVGIVETQHLGGRATVGSGSSYATIGGGRMHLAGPYEAALSFVGAAGPDLTLRYTVSSGGVTEYGGRPARVLNVKESGILRMQMIVDESTSAPVATEVYANDGTVFRYSSMIEFSVSVDPAMAMTDDKAYEMMLPVKDTDLPRDVAGYQLVDAYAGPQGAQQAFYTDGLFSFSAFTTAGRMNWRAVIEDGVSYHLGEHSYLRVIGPTSVWVLWNAPGATIALVGDLPPDHLEEVLAGLPRPGTDGWLKRLWSQLFG